MYDNYNYPLGADTPDAPWNQSEPQEIEVDVEVTITMHKWLRVSVTDYTHTRDIEYDDEGGSFACDDYDFRDCDFKKAIRDQVFLPNELADEVEASHIELGEHSNLKRAIEDCKGWEVDEIIVEDYEKV